MAAIDWPTVIRGIFSRETALTLSIAVLIIGVVLGYVVWRGTRQFLTNAGIPEVVEGTPFERTAQSFGTSTVGIIAQLVALFIYGGSVIIALNVAQLVDSRMFWTQVTNYFPSLFVAALAIIAGLVLGDKAKVVVANRLRSIKLPEAELVPVLVKYSVFYIAALIALSQLGVATLALLVLLGAYAFGIVFLSGLALHPLLSASASGIYLLLSEPYSIGDQVRVDDIEGIVQEVDMVVTRIESDEEEYILPNDKVLTAGVVRLRDE
jgi:small-conductance mechanosensitive channel